MITRRNLLSLLPAFVAAPAIIRVADLMAIKAVEPEIVALDFPWKTIKILIPKDFHIIRTRQHEDDLLARLNANLYSTNPTT